MSEESDRVLGVNSLPIFPLPLVLMPFEMLPLHIFEQQYRDMLTNAQLGNKLIGISLFDPKDEFTVAPEVGSIGCVAEIKESETLPDGRSNILTVGVIRYEILGYRDTDDSYLVAEPKFFEDESEDGIDGLADEVFELFRRTAEASHKLSGQTGSLPEIPKAPPEQLSFLVSAALGLDSATKYELIKTRSTRTRLEKMKDLLETAVGRVEENAEIDKISRTNGHAKKKIDYEN